jgi:hypothetical protein
VIKTNFPKQVVLDISDNFKHKTNYIYLADPVPGKGYKNIFFYEATLRLVKECNALIDQDFIRL